MQDSLQSQKPLIIVVGNEKGGAGKSTFSMHLIIGLLERGFNVSSIDTDIRQKTLTSYIENRIGYNKDNPDHLVLCPVHRHIKGSLGNNNQEDESENLLRDAITEFTKSSDIIVIDTPGSYTNLSKIAHSYADKVITPINDSFIDLDVIAKIDGKKIDFTRPSIYSEMLWEQKMERASRDGGSIDWIVVRNRLSNLDALNKRNMNDALDKCAKRMSFRVAPGLSERVIYRELFSLGLTLLDLKKANFNKSFNSSHITARLELKNFIDFLQIKI